MSFGGYSISQLKCLKYFYIKKDNKLVSIEEFVEGFKKANSKRLLTHDILITQLYLYRDKEYKYSELFNDKVGNLQMSRYYNQFLSLEMWGKEEKTHYLLKIIDTLDRYINKARYELIKCSNIIDIDFFNSDINDHVYEYYYLQRCWNAENAIYSYYSAFEILMQIIWIYKGYYNGNNLNQVLGSYSFKVLIDKLKKQDNDIFLNKFFSTKYNQLLPEFKYVRSCCNKFKHKGVLRFEGEAFDNEPKIKVINIKDNIKEIDFTSDNFQYEYIDLDYEVIPKLINYHNEILELSKYIISKIDLYK